MLFVGCEKSVEHELKEKQVLFFYAYHGNSYWENDTNIFVETEHTSGRGVLLADSTPVFEYFKMGKESFSDSEYVKLFEGYISFGDYDFDGNAIITSDFNPLNVEVKTSLGKISGSLNFPDKIQSIILSEYDSLALGDPFTITWTGSNADFYNVSCNYHWRDGDGNLGTTVLSEFVSDTSITFPGSLFLNNGEINFIFVIPQNGPPPSDNSVGNMSGDGDGFLYYSIAGTGHKGESITVGVGSKNGYQSQSSYQIMAKEKLDKSRAMLEKKIRESRQNYNE